VSCRFAHDDGAYVLGALSPAERLDFERHLEGCDDCTRAVRELAGLPGLLGRVDVSVLEHPAVDEPLPDTLLPALSREVRRDRRRRSFVAAALAAAAVVVAVMVPPVVSQVTDGHGSALAVPQRSATPSGSAPQAMNPVGDVPVRASLTLDKVTWGTRLGLTCTYDPEWVEYQLPPSVTYVLYVRTRDGHTEQVGTWRSVGGRTMRLSAATAASRENIASVEVRTTGGRVLLQLTA
jgi:hypothetical protein